MLSACPSHTRLPNCLPAYLAVCVSNPVFPLGCLADLPCPAFLLAGIHAWLFACPYLSLCWPVYLPDCLPAHTCLSAGLSTYLAVCLPIPVFLLACLPAWLPIPACPSVEYDSCLSSFFYWG